MGEKRCFWIFNWWEQVDENKGSSDVERTFPFPSSFLTFFPYGGKIVLAADSPNLSSFCLRSDGSRSASCVKQLQQIWRSVIGWWPWEPMGTVKFPMFIASTVFGDFLSGYHVGGREPYSIDGFVGMVVPSCMERKTEHQLELLTNAHHKDMKRCPKLGKHRVPSWGKFLPCQVR